MQLNYNRMFTIQYNTIQYNTMVSLVPSLQRKRNG